MASQGVTGTASRLSQMQKFRAAMRRHVPLAADPSQEHLMPPLILNESWAGRRLMEALQHLPHSNAGVSLDISAPTGNNQRMRQKAMRFQQKQLQDRAHRRVELTGNTASDAPDGTTTGQKPIGNGKVRQMFDERRRGAGIDRSHPLKPITTMTTKSRTSKSTTALSTTTMRATGGAAAARRQSPMPMRSQVTIRRTVARSDGGMGSRDGNLNHVDELAHLESEAFGEKFSSMSLNDSRLNGAGDRNNNSNGGCVMSREQSSSSIKLKPVITKKSPVTTAARAPAVRQVTASAMANGSPTASGVGSIVNRTVRTGTATREKLVSAVVKTPPKKSEDKMSMYSLGKQQTPVMGAMSACRYCGRHFNQERLAKHEHICQRMMNTKRKVFDASKHRVKGTEAEKYMKKPPNSRNARSAYTNRSMNTNMNMNMNTNTNTNSAPKNNWRKKHEDFIAAIRAAKEVQAHLARGGKLSDLPPPPPSENPDYIQCPHCMRRFNEAAAERHIPRCANMQHNKPKAGSNAGNKKRY